MLEISYSCYKSVILREITDFVLMDLQEKVRMDGIALGMCEKFQQEWQSPQSVEQLCWMYHRGQDFCIEKDYPTVEDLQAFGAEPKQYGVYATDGVAYNQPHVVVVGNADVSVEVSCVTDLTVRHNATVRIRIHEGAYCYVSAYDNCHVIVEHKGKGSRLCMSYYGGTVENKEQFDTINNKKQ